MINRPMKFPRAGFVDSVRMKITLGTDRSGAPSMQAVVKDQKVLRGGMSRRPYSFFGCVSQGVYTDNWSPLERSLSAPSVAWRDGQLAECPIRKDAARFAGMVRKTADQAAASN